MTLTKEARVVNARNYDRQATPRSSSPASDGTFRFDDLAAGDWILTVSISAGQKGNWQRLGTLEYEFTVADISGGQSDEPLDLGDLEVQRIVRDQPALLRPSLPVGTAAPDFELVKINPIVADGQFEETDEWLRLAEIL